MTNKKKPQQRRALSERKAIKKIMADEGIKYTEALRKYEAQKLEAQRGDEK